MRWSAPGAEGLLETAETLFRSVEWPDAPPGFDLLGARRPMRQVLEGSLPWPGTPKVVVKWNRPVTATDEVARYLRGGKGPREGRLLLALADAGVAAPRALAFTDEGVDLLITEHLEGLEPLPPREVASNALIEAIGTFLGRAWRAGLRHRDLHRGNLALKDGSLLLIDVGGASLASGGGLVTEMARAASGLTGGLTRTQRMRAVRAFLRAAETAEPERRRLIDVSEAVDRRARDLTRRYRLGRDRRATRTGRHYEVFRVEGASGVRRRDAPEAWTVSCASWIDGDPDGAVPLKPDGRVIRAVLPDREGEVVLKRYPAVAPGRLPRAVRAFRLAAMFEHRFVPAPRALLAFANRKGSVLISEHVPGENLHAFTAGGRGGAFASLPHEQRWALLDALGRFLRHMHEEEISHRDLKAPNLIVSDVAGRSFVIADLEGARRRIVSWKRRAHDLARLDASLDASDTARARVLRAYQRAGRRPPVDARTFARWIADRVAWKRGPSGRPR